MRCAPLAPLCLLVASCGGGAETYTLYRTSSIELATKGTQDIRVHWATFDANESDPGYNLNNCSMAMDLLNANIAKLNGGQHPVKFWCEKGRFRP